MMFFRDRWKDEVNFFIRELQKSFSDFISGLVAYVVAESFYKGFLKVFSSKQVFPNIGN